MNILTNLSSDLMEGILRQSHISICLNRKHLIS